MKLHWKPEKTIKAWALRLLIGPAMVIDGILHFITLGCLSAGCALEVSRSISIERFMHLQDKQKVSK